MTRGSYHLYLTRPMSTTSRRIAIVRQASVRELAGNAEVDDATLVGAPVTEIAAPRKRSTTDTSTMSLAW